MACTIFVYVYILFFLLQTYNKEATSDGFNLAPIFSPIIDNVCKEVECGKGSCKPSRNSTFFYQCECEPGWSQSFSNDNDDDDDDDDHGFEFLPCIIPNCSLDYTCANTSAPAPAPGQEKKRPTNSSLFDPCSWADCGGGKCNKTSQFTYTCQCDENYNNLLNTTSLPCFRDCALGGDCSNLGISILKPPSSPPPSTLSTKSSNQAGAILPSGVFKWLALVVILMVLVI